MEIVEYLQIKHFQRYQNKRPTCQREKNATTKMLTLRQKKENKIQFFMTKKKTAINIRVKTQTI